MTFEEWLNIYMEDWDCEMSLKTMLSDAWQAGWEAHREQIHTNIDARYGKGE